MVRERKHVCMKSRRRMSGGVKSRFSLIDYVYFPGRRVNGVGDEGKICLPGLEERGGMRVPGEHEVFTERVN